MSDAPHRLLTRQELYDRIREGSKDTVIVEEMVRLGFWQLGSLPEDPAEDLLRIAELERKVRAIATENSRLQNIDAMKAALHKRRLATARAKREETKARREARRVARAKAWTDRKATEILYLGEGASGNLGKRDSKVKPGLPDLADAAALAKAMGISVGALRFLAFHRKVSPTTHYKRFHIAKKSGGKRLISAPLPRLKAVQHWILRSIVSKVPIHAAAHGFVPGRSIVTNAAAHLGRKVVVNFDLENFFPTLTYARVRGLFASFGYSPEASTILGLLCTEADVEEVEIDGKRYYVHTSERHLPQGSPCSPAITNAVCLRLDQRLTGLARKLGFTYTRYADDLTFSGDPDRVNALLGAVHAIVEDEGFKVNTKKTHIMRRAGRQEVTGIVVNDKLGVPRRFVHRWRAVLFQVAKDGVEGKRFGASDDVAASLIGFAAFVSMVDPTKGKVMLEDARRITGYVPPKRPPPSPPPPAAPDVAVEPTPAAAEAPGEPTTPKWWEFWKWKP